MPLARRGIEQQAATGKSEPCKRAKRNFLTIANALMLLNCEEK
jgi:hypothetical protein